MAQEDTELQEGEGMVAYCKSQTEVTLSVLWCNKTKVKRFFLPGIVIVIP